MYVFSKKNEYKEINIGLLTKHWLYKNSTQNNFY